MTQTVIGRAPVPRANGLPRLLFVSHEASRTGAPIMLWNFLRWVREHTDLPFEILCLAGGPLVRDFSALAPTHVVAARGVASLSYIEAGMARAGMADLSDRVKVTRLRRATRHLTGFDGIYLNSATSTLALRVLPEVPPVVVSHIHEMASALVYWFPEKDRDEMLRRTDRFVAAAEVVADDLVDRLGVDRSIIHCHHEFIEPHETDACRAASARRSLGISDDAFVVGASGHVIWRKGPDLFLQMAADLVRRRPELDVHFVWVGDTTAEDVAPLEHDIAKLELTGRVHFIGEHPSPGDFFAAFDVFCLTSREDPFPLVMLEVAAQGVPVVSFANGGSVEFARSADGRPNATIVPYLDVEGMATEVLALLDDPIERKLLGDRGRERVELRHTVDAAAPRLYHDLLGMLGHDASAGVAP